MAGIRAADPRVTFAELASWPDDGRGYELYEGEVIVVPEYWLIDPPRRPWRSTDASH